MTTHDLVLPPTEGEHHGAGEAESTPGEGRATSASPASPAPPFTAEEWDAINTAIWSDLEGDPHRIADLLSTAVGTLAGMALDASVGPYESVYLALAVRALREMEQRALWGPEQEDHR